MPTNLLFRRGNTAQTAAFTGLAGEITIDTDRKVVIVHDGSKVGGYPLITKATDIAFKNEVFDAANTRPLQNTTSATTFSPGNLTVTGNVTLSGTGAFYGIGMGYSNMVALTTGTSWTIPTGVKRVKFTAIGGGGGAGTTAASAGYSGGGGGSGAVVIGYIDVIAGQTSITYAVGAAGAAAGNGGDSTVTYNSVLLATAGGGLLGVTSSVGGAGGTASGVAGTILYNGNHGWTGGVGSATNPVTGMGGNTPLGFGQGGPKQTAGSLGIAGTGYGAGGGGGATSTTTARAGGAGAPGLIMFEW